MKHKMLKNVCCGVMVNAPLFLQNLGEEFNLKITLIKLKVTGFKEKYPIHCKVIFFSV